MVVALLTVTIACSESGTPPQPKNNSTVKSMQFKHANGLMLTLPDGTFRVQESETGFHIEPPDAASIRNPFEIAIVLRAGESPSGEWPETRHLGKVAARYRTEVVAGGSGGDEHALTAWIPCPAGYVVVRQTQQLEPPEKPDFGPAWTVLGAVRCENPTPRN